MPLSIFKRLFICFCFALLTALPAQAEEQKNGSLPPALETALSTLLADAPQGKADPDAATVNAVLDFVATNKQAANKVRPEARPQGSGAYLKETLNVPLRKLVEYMRDPSIPGVAIYPSAVRRNAWMPGSPILKDIAALTDDCFLKDIREAPALQKAAQKDFDQQKDGFLALLRAARDAVKRWPVKK